jgi:hypothetical protein
VHESISSDYAATVGFGDALMTEAYAEKRNLFTEAQDDFLANTSFAWRARAWGNADVVWSYVCDFIN